MRWPESQNVKIPEGHYSFKLNKEAELKKFTYFNKDGVEAEGVKVIIFATGLGPNGTFRVADAFLPWEERYDTLKKVLGVDSSRDVEVSGAIFEGDIIHQPDKKDPTKSYPRIVNIKASNDIPPSNGGDGDDIPF